MTIVYLSILTGKHYYDTTCAESLLLTVKKICDTSRNMVTCAFPELVSEKTIDVQECSSMTYVHSSKDYDDTDMQVDLLSCLLKVP